VLESDPNVSVTLTTGDVITLTDSITTLSPAAQSYAATAGIADQFILRRGRVLNFIEAVPRQRYEVLRPFLALSEVSDLEAALAAAVQQVEAKEVIAKKEEDSACSDLLRLPGLQFAETDTCPTAVLAGIQQALAETMFWAPADLAGIPIALKKIDAAISAAQEKLASLRPPPTTQPDLSSLRSLSVFPDGFTTKPFLQALAEEQAREAVVIDEAATSLGSALSDISTWIQQSGATECPVCERPIDPQQVSAQINLRISPLNDLVAAQAIRKSRQRALAEAIQQVLNAVIRASARPRSVTDDWWNPREAALVESRQKLESVQRAVDASGAGVPLADGALDEVSTALEQLASEAIQTVAASGSKSSEATQLDDRIARLYQLREALPQIDSLLAVRASRREATKEAVKRAGIARRVLSYLQDARKETVQEIYEEIAADIESFYSQVHPSEAVGGISLEVRTAGRGSANLRGRFHDRRGEDPRAYYSEAHLDTLGICVFLALRKRYLQAEPAFDLLILDDVLTSIDAPHASRLADLLLTEFAGCQFMITTHNRVWYEHLRGLIAGKGLDQNLVSLRIHDWTLEQGPDIRDFTEERLDLEEAVKSGSLPEIAGGAGRLLENLLGEMRFEMGLAVEARRDERYTLGDIWPAFKKRVRKRFKGLSSLCGGLIADIDRLWFTRNWAGAHYNQWAKELSIKDARELANAVLALFDHLRCPQCLRFVTTSVTPVGQLACRKGCTVIFEK